MGQMYIFGMRNVVRTVWFAKTFQRFCPVNITMHSIFSFRLNCLRFCVIFVANSTDKLFLKKIGNFEINNLL